MKRRFKQVLSLALVLCMVFSLMCINISAASTTTGTKPDDGTTTGQPFSSGTGGSTYFRIPAMVTLDDGTIVAAADARWNGSSDGYGLDTIVSRSTDGGETWSYTFANYLGDNGNVLNNSSTAFIDPCLATDGETVYMLVDLYPGGTVISNAQAGTGYDSDGHLMLKASGSSSYDYYLGDFNSDGYAYIYNYSTGEYVGGYTVDQWFNVYVQGVLESNLFYSGCAYTVLPTSYLYLTTSTDGGATWSAPTMLNSQVKNSDDEFYGVGPGSGLVTSTGRIIFSCYTYVTSDGNTSVIYSDDGGVTWTRSADMSEQSSEATMVEADGTIYMFTRHGGYYYSTDNGTTWSSKQTVSGISYTTSCQLNAMVYSQKIDGCTAILLSAPTSNRTTGKIFVGLVQDDGSISWDYTYSVNGSSHYAYSCLTELSDGTVALLYESGSAAITYTTLDIEDIASGATIGSTDTVTDEATGITATAEGLTSISVTKGDTTTGDNTVSISYTITLNGGDYTGAATVKIPVDSAFADCDVFTGDVDGTSFTVTQDGDYLICEVPHFSTVTITGVAATASNDATETVEVTVYVGYTTTITDETGNYESSYTGDGLNTDVATVSVTGTTVAGGTTVEKASSITSGSSYYIGDGNGNYLVLSGSSLTNTTNISSATQWTITSSGSGYTIKSGDYYVYYSDNHGTITFSASTSSAVWSYSSSKGFYFVGGPNTYYLTYSSGWTATSSASTYSAAYTATTTEDVDATTIAITGVAVGTTSVIVGNTQYNITVEEAPEYVDVTTSPFTSGTGVNSGNTTPVTKLTISKTLSYDLNLNSDVLGSSSYTVVWSSADESIATVNQNGTVTGVSAGETSVTATVTFSDGSTAVYTIPVVVRDDGVSYSSNLKTYDYYIDEITDTTVYMGILYGTTDRNVVAYDLVEVIEGEAIYIAFESNAGTAVDFFAKANTGYALTDMTSTNSAGHYMALDSDAPASTTFITYSGAAGANQVTAFGSTVVYQLVQKALDLDCEGGMGWTRGSDNTSSVTSLLTFRSEKLPTVEKEIISITHNDTTTAYTEGMTAEAGDVITYTITVTKYASTSTINYSNATLTDNLSGATFSGTSSSTADVTTNLTNSGLEAGTYTYTVTYTVADNDLDTTITNTVDLSYTYASSYSHGTFGGSAEAEASFVATSFEGVDLVVDFGLPVSYTYEAWGKDSVTLQDTGSASYGTVTVSGDRTNGWTVTYTPNTVLLGVDTVTMYGSNGAEYTFKVYPATTVYYEEGFATYGTGWSVEGTGDWATNTNKGTSYQETEIANTANNTYKNYNYDDAYRDCTTGSESTAASTETSGDSLSFTFTGTGVDIFANRTSSTGIIMIKITDSDGNTEKMLTVDTVDAGTYVVDTGATAYNSPIASVSDLAYDTHTVTIYVVEDETFNFDGFRVYDTIKQQKTDTTSDAYTIQTTVYEADNEDYPVYYELRNNVLAGLNVSTSVSTYASDIAKTTIAQVYATGTDNTSGAVVYYSGSGSVLQEDTDVQTLLDDGPKNELYLYPGMTVVFKITTSREVQIGLRSVTGDSVSYTVNSGSVQTISSSVDMFYDLQTKTTGDATEVTYTISVPSTSSGILSITNIKVCDCADESVFGELTEEDLTAALISLGYAAGEEDTETTADATLTVNLVDYTGSVLASTELTDNGTEGENATFAASDILAAVNEALPSGYALVDESSVSDQTVAYGDTGSVNVQIGKVATLTVTFQKYSGLFRKTTVATVTLTKVQTGSSSRATFSSSEIKAAVPSGYKALLAASATVSYGSSAAKTVTVY